MYSAVVYYCEVHVRLAEFVVRKTARVVTKGAGECGMSQLIFWGIFVAMLSFESKAINIYRTASASTT